VDRKGELFLDPLENGAPAFQSADPSLRYFSAGGSEVGANFLFRLIRDLHQSVVESFIVSWRQQGRSERLFRDSKATYHRAMT
jgi:hypothetical protein